MGDGEIAQDVTGKQEGVLFPLEEGCGDGVAALQCGGSWGDTLSKAVLVGKGGGHSELTQSCFSGRITSDGRGKMERGYVVSPP